MTNFLDTLASTIETILMEDASDEAIAKLAKAVADHAARFPRSHIGIRKQRFARHVIDAIDSAYRYRNADVSSGFDDGPAGGVLAELARQVGVNAPADVNAFEASLEAKGLSFGVDNTTGQWVVIRVSDRAVVARSVERAEEATIRGYND